jgi:UDP-MurNAc hydroxylase
MKLEPPDSDEEIVLCGYAMERYCPHRQADLSVFGEVEDGVLTCTLHGWQFDLASGECLTAMDRRLRVRPAP